MPHAGSLGAAANCRSGAARRAERRIAAAAAAIIAALAGAPVAGAPAASASTVSASTVSASTVSATTGETVIVTAAGLVNAVAAVLSVGGTILTQFHLINGVEAVVPAAVEPVLAAVPGIIVTPDVSVNVQSTPASTGPHTPSDAFLQQTGATRLAAAGDTGQGVTVAVLDTGIDNLPDFSGRLIGGVDLTGGRNPFQDSYGHGTFVAGLIAGNGSSSGGQYAGEAPGASLVSIKVAGADGKTDLAGLITGLQWAVDHKSGYGIKVLNMSLGFQAVTSTVINPLDRAVEAVWGAGIAVVASAGNAGPFNGTVLSPGDDPLVITVGALNDMAASSAAGDEMCDFSSAGPTSPDGWVKPDLVASGRSVVSLAAPGSTIYDDHPSARVGSADFAGSGTSFSSAITSGAAALVLAAHPGLSPNQLKARLLGTTGSGPVGNPFTDGHGALDAYGAATAGPMNLSQSAALLLPALPGTMVQLSPAGPVDTWNPDLWSGTSWTPGPSDDWTWPGLAWNGADWDGWTWTGRAWNTGDWAGAIWNGANWTGRAWNGSDWAGSAFDGRAWNGSAWNSSAWN
jgi:serine protease AprX